MIDVNEKIKQQESQPPWPVINNFNLGNDYAEGPTIKVRARRTLYYDFCRRHENDVFTLHPKRITVVDPATNRPVKENGVNKLVVVSAESQFDEEIMERLDDNEPEVLTTAQQALDRTSEEIESIRRGPGRPPKNA